ncbi:hypothetical protein BJX63DRAFT_185077 [Aspergillus granulosus]|uniref:Uncharacterized protein n=1 Tax=Aspergillus granulosus TaxID=176169 RepID=A0ABR4HI08_9EURO
MVHQAAPAPSALDIARFSNSATCPPYTSSQSLVANNPLPPDPSLHIESHRIASPNPSSRSKVVTILPRTTFLAVCIASTKRIPFNGEVRVQPAPDHELIKQGSHGQARVL